MIPTSPVRARAGERGTVSRRYRDPMMKINCFLLVIFSTLFVAASASASGETIEIEACEVPFTDIGERSSFAGTAIYALVTDEHGSPRMLDELKNPLRPFLDLTAFERCMQRWKLSPSEQYSVALSAGTTGKALEYWTIAICDINRACIIVKLPRTRRRAE